MTPTKTSFELLPEALQGHIAGYVDFTIVLELQEVSSYLKHITKHIKHVNTAFTGVDKGKLTPFITRRLKTLKYDSTQYWIKTLVSNTPYSSHIRHTCIMKVLVTPPPCNLLEPWWNQVRCNQGVKRAVRENNYSSNTGIGTILSIT